MARLQLNAAALRSTRSYLLSPTRCSPLPAFTPPRPEIFSRDPRAARSIRTIRTIIPNAQYITVTLGNVNDTDGNFSSEVPAVMGLLIGDTNANGAVNAGDVAQTKFRLGQAVDATNFRSDVIADGEV